MAECRRTETIARQLRRIARAASLALQRGDTLRCYGEVLIRVPLADGVPQFVDCTLVKVARREESERIDPDATAAGSDPSQAVN